MATKTIKDEKVYLGQTGKFYHITSATTCKRVGAVENSFIENLDVEALPEDIERQNTKILHKFLQRHLDDVTFKRGYVYYKGFRISYESHGFEIRDNINYGEIQNINKYHNDFPLPEDVLAFLKQNADRAIKPPPASGAVADVLDIAETLNKNFKVRVTPPKAEEVVAKPEVEKKPELTVKQRLTKLARLTKKFQDDVLDHYSYREEAMKLTNRNIRFKVDKLFNKFRKKEIRFKGFHAQLLDYFTNMEVIVPPSEKPKRQPKFKALEFEECFHVEVKGNKVSYLVEGPSQQVSKRISMLEDLHVFRVREVLAKVPKAMTYLMKVALGKMTAADIDEEHFDRSYVRDIYQAYDEKIIRNSEHKDEIIKACIDFCRYNEIESVLDRKYLQSVQVGDMIEVTSFLGSVTSYWYKVVSKDAGIRVVDLSSGELFNLMKWEYVTDIRPKQIKRGK